MNGFNTSFAPIPARGYNLFVATDFAADAAEQSVDLGLDSGRSATIDVVGPDGQPVGETLVRGLGNDGGRFLQRHESSRIEVLAIDPATPRRLTILHEARKLAGSAYLKGDEPGPIAIRLQPWGTIAGRVVDDEGKPRKGVDLMGRDQLDDRPTRPASKPGGCCREGRSGPPSRSATTAASGSTGSCPACVMEGTPSGPAGAWATCSGTSSSGPARSRTWATSSPRRNALEAGPMHSRRFSAKMSRRSGHDSPL